MTWDSTSTYDGSHVLLAKATANSGQAACVSHAVTTGTAVQGSWVGTYGVDGYAIGGWNGSTDLVALPNATLSLEQGSRVQWATTTETRALTSPAQTERRASTFYHATQLRLRLNFTQAYAGTLHLYALDWDTTSRREEGHRQ